MYLGTGKTKTGEKNGWVSNSFLTIWEDEEESEQNTSNFKSAHVEIMLQNVLKNCNFLALVLLVFHI